MSSGRSRSSSTRSGRWEWRCEKSPLKGLLAGCGGKRAAQAAQRVENAGEAKNLSDIDPLLNALDTQIEFLRQATLAYRP